MNKNNKIQFFEGAIEDVAFQKNTQLFANPYYYFDLNKSIAWRDDGRDDLPGREASESIALNTSWLLTA